MPRKFWIKLHIEILDNDEFGTLPEFMKWRAIELFLVAGENGNDGLLPPVARLAWRLRLDEAKIAETLSALTQVGVVHETPKGWVVTNFKKSQYSESFERVKRYRERLSNHSGNAHEIKDDSIYDSGSSSDSDSEEGGVGGETPVPAEPWTGTQPVPAARCRQGRQVQAGLELAGAKPPPASTLEQEFNAHFGGFYSPRERERWQTLYEAIGFARLSEIAAWAEKREIALTNRGALLDSLETAARKWTDKHPKPKGDNTEFFKNLAVASEDKG